MLDFDETDLFQLLMTNLSMVGTMNNNSYTTIEYTSLELVNDTTRFWLVTCDCSNFCCDFTTFWYGKSYLFPQCTGHVWSREPAPAMKNRRVWWTECMSLVPPHCTVGPNHIAVHCHMMFLYSLSVLITLKESQDFFVATAEVVKLFNFTS